ncbi:MAG: hypothetical protein LQ352_008145 [Teloschistes flavicans]|nr:MAG: hypothetical protein LQ352_008145 [Teloschistes flavicans]
MAGPSPTDREYQLAHIRDDRSTEIIVAFAVTLGFAIITVLLRFVSRHLTRAPLGGDDWTIVAALICAIGYVVGQSVCINYGLGKHVVVVTDPVSFAKAVDASVPFYITSLALTKVSFLLLYRRIFPQRHFHVILWVIGTVTVAFTIANVFFVIFSCHPIRGAWNPLIKAKCINGDAAVLAVAILTIITDLIILGLPLPLVWKLHLPALQKLQLSGVLLIGLFATGVSIYRSTRITGVSQADISYDSTDRSLWSGVEIDVAIVCANLATLRPILNYLRTGRAVSTVRVGSSKESSRYSSKSGQGRWTWRSVKTPENHVGNDGTFHRLKHENGAQNTEDVEGQRYEGYQMSPLASARVPGNVHFDHSDRTRPQTALLPDNKVQRDSAVQQTWRSVEG